MNIAELRQAYHNYISKSIIRIQTDGEYPNFADKTNRASKAIAWGIVNRLGCPSVYENMKGQMAGNRFEKANSEFLSEAFKLLQHLRPGRWDYETHQTRISRFDQYEHLADIEKLVKKDKELRIVLGADYLVEPDIVVSRWPISDQEINLEGEIVNADQPYATLTPLRAANSPISRRILHASISCKWTTRSDRSQNTRTEALNLIRNRKGHLPHIVAVTAEPLPTRIAPLALGTGDLDCVYHFALRELQESVSEIDNEDQLDMLNVMIEGRRLRDIADLPFDLIA